MRVAIDRGGSEWSILQSYDPVYPVIADAPEAFCDVWAFIPTHLFCPPIPSELLGNAVVIPGNDNDNDNGNDRDAGVQVTFKLLSVDPANYDDAPSEGIRRLLQIATRQHIPKGQVYDTSIIGEWSDLCCGVDSCSCPAQTAVLLRQIVWG
jgi:hypothetical protein